MLEVGLFGGNRVSEINLPALYIDRASGRACDCSDGSVASIAATDISTSRLKVLSKIIYLLILIRIEISFCSSFLFLNVVEEQHVRIRM